MFEDIPKPPLFGLSHYLQAMQIAQALKAQQYAEQDRQMRLEDRQRAIAQNEEELQRRRANDVITLNQGHARKVDSGPKADLIRKAIDDTHAQVTMPGLGQYELPTPEEEDARKVKSALELRKLTEQPLNVPEELQGILGSPTVNVPHEGALTTAANVWSLLNPPTQTHFTTDENGNVHAIDYQTKGNPKNRGIKGESVIPNAGKPSRTSSRSSKLTVSELNQSAQDEVINSQFGGQRFIPNPAIAAAAAQRVASGKSRNQQEAEWYIRNGNPNTIKLLYPQLFKDGKLEDRIDVTTTPEYKTGYMKSRSRMMQQNRGQVEQPGKVAGGGGERTVPASRIAAEAKKRGISVNEARRRLAANGFTIDEEK